MRCTKRSDGCSRGVQSDEVDGNIAVIAERRGDRQAGGERTAEAVDKDIDTLTLVLGEGRVNGLSVEVGASDVTFERDVVCGF